MSESLLNLAVDAFANASMDFNARIVLIARDHKVLCVTRNKLKTGDAGIFEGTVNEIAEGLTTEQWTRINSRLKHLRKENII